jgi:hypothetical protein
MKYIFMIYAIDIARINMFVLIHGQTLQNLTLTKKYMQHILGLRKYYFL